MFVTWEALLPPPPPSFLHALLLVANFSLLGWHTRQKQNEITTKIHFIRVVGGREGNGNFHLRAVLAASSDEPLHDSSVDLRSSQSKGPDSKVRGSILGFRVSALSPMVNVKLPRGIDDCPTNWVLSVSPPCLSACPKAIRPIYKPNSKHIIVCRKQICGCIVTSVPPKSWITKAIKEIFIHKRHQ